MTAKLASKCVQDIVDKLAAVTEFKNKVHQVYTESELADRTKGISYPLIAVVYDGMASIPERGESSKLGLGAEIKVSIIMFFRSQAMATTNQTLDAVDSLDTVRDKIKGTTAPSGHKWRFVSEVGSQGAEKGVYVYVQRWSAPIQLT